MSEKYNTQPYIDSISRYRETLIEALDICNNSFQPPEVHVETSRAVMNAAWDMQIQYCALVNYRTNVVTPPNRKGPKLTGTHLWGLD